MRVLRMYHLLIGSLLFHSCQKGELSRPNIIFIMADDHTIQAFGVYGSRLAELDPTPNIDRLAHEGILFENAFCTNSTIPDPEYAHLAYQEYLKRYLRCVKSVDDNVGRLFAYLEENDLMDNTIIIYTGGQGFMLGEHDYIDKRWMYDESQRMPFLVRYPGKIKAGTRTDAIVNNVDYAPTMIELARGTVPEYMQGESFKTIIETGEEPEGWGNRYGYCTESTTESTSGRGWGD